MIIDLEKQMHNAAGSPDFGKAIALRDRIKKLNERLAGK
ncbi:MAG: UvrB/UvrC motif-containing protein [Methanoregula sp.]|nr:UvrB/UvrC motif-containing protein [Methanoregula sp.]